MFDSLVSLCIECTELPPISYITHCRVCFVLVPYTNMYFWHAMRCEVYAACTIGITSERALAGVPLGWNTGGDPLVNMEGQAHHHVFSIYRPDRRKFYETRRTVTQTPVAGMPSRYGHPPW